MARMRRIQVVIDPELDERLGHEAAARGVSKSALVRDCVARGLAAEVDDNGLLALLELSKALEHVEPVDVDTELYGPLEASS
jgi:hypothetical protein